LTLSAAINHPEVEPLLPPLYKGGYRQKSHISQALSALETFIYANDNARVECHG
jgi:hypothetical protein